MCSAADSHGDSLVVMNLTTPVRWQIYFSQVFETLYGPSESEGMFLVQRWSLDGKYLYFTQFVASDPGWPLADGNALLRLDLSNGSVVGTIYDTSEYQPYSFAFSQGEALLAYVPHYLQPLGVHILDMASGFERVIPLTSSFQVAGQTIWSEEQRKLIMLVGEGEYPEFSYHVAVVDLQADSWGIVGPEVRLPFAAFGWVSDGILEFHANYHYEEPVIWYLDVSAGTLTPKFAPSAGQE